MIVDQTTESATKKVRGWGACLQHGDTGERDDLYPGWEGARRHTISSRYSEQCTI